MMNNRLLISFSGGETSALMTLLLLTKYKNKYDDVAVVFANTGQEHDETLDFVFLCDAEFDFNCVWVEAEVHHGKRKASTHKIVNYFTASRDGRPFEEVIKKYGIPNSSAPMCTRELKSNPIRSYITNEKGWKTGTYDVAIGIRADESKRRSMTAKEANIVYPLLDWFPMTKPEVNDFWNKHNFRLNLAGYQGNCKWCWKKSMRKHLTIMDDDPSIFDFPERMEKQYGLIGPEFKKPHKYGKDYRRVFFRQYLSVKDIRRIYDEQKNDICRAENDAVIYKNCEISLDMEPSDGCCTESCEVNWEDQ